MGRSKSRHLRGYDTPKEARFRKFIQDLIAEGVNPTPTEVLNRQGNEKFAGTQSSGGPMFSGSLSEIRIDVYKNLGWTRDGTGKWCPPSR